METNNAAHWDAIYRTTPTEKQGWYEALPQPSLDLISRCQLQSNDPLMDAGAGASTLLDHLLQLGYPQLYAVDLSRRALDTARARLGEKLSNHVNWIVADLTDSQSFAGIPAVRLWHDRAVLHFMTAEKQRAAYLHTLKSVLQPGGYVILAAFAVGGASHCSGLPVYNYDEGTFSDFLGTDFTILDCIQHLYRMPSGDKRPYTYLRAQYCKPA
jgi:SAM-dependent methyltransferase